jgi:hypothetical protein
LRKRRHEGGARERHPPAPSWRDTIPIHPAAELLPLMGKDELAEFAADIETNELQEPIKLVDEGDAGASLLDGRNRLDALELVLGRPVRVASYTRRGHVAWRIEADDEDGVSVPVSDFVDYAESAFLKQGVLRAVSAGVRLDQA